MEVGEFADSIKDRITSFNSLALAQSLRSHAFCNKKKKEDVSTHCCFAYENPKSTPLPLYIVLSFFELHSDKCAEVKRLIKEEGAEESRASYYESIHSDDALHEGHTLRWAPLR